MDLLNLLVKITADSSDAEKQVGGFAGKVGKTLGGIAKVGGAAIAAGGAAVVAVTKQAVDSYSEYEQLTGGIQTLYGENSKAADDMMQHASEAWKTAGMSANDYMDTAIQSSAALINSLGGDTEKAAELMDMSITDMSDNVNKMGTTMESVQNAYRGFSRGNFTMLDNLALGFAGTKEGMQELLDKAEELSGVKFDISSYSDIVEAIHVVQTEMGVSGMTAKEAAEAVQNGLMTEEEAYEAMGTTAKEAMTTIQGSMSAAKAAWSNLVTGIADENANLDELVSNFIESIGTVGDNILPRVEQILQGLGTAIEKLAPQLAEGAVSLITNVAPQLVKAAGSLVMSIGKAIIDNLPTILDAAVEIVLTLADGLVDALPELIPAIVKVILTIVEKLTDPDTLAKLIEAAFKILGALAEGLINAIPELLKATPTIMKNLFESIISYVPNMVKGGMELVKGIAQGILGMVDAAIDSVKELLGKIKDAILGIVDKAKQWGADMIQNFTNGIKSKISGVVSAVSGIASRVKSFLGFSEPEEGPLSNFSTYAPDMMKLFAKGIKDSSYLVIDQANNLKEQISDAFDNAFEFYGIDKAKLKSQFDIGGMLNDSLKQYGVDVPQVASNTYNIVVNGIEELDEMLRWYNSRQVRARMA